MLRTKTPLPVWFWGAYLVTTQTPGMSALQFQRQLGVKRYETTFQMLHKLRAQVTPAKRGQPSSTQADKTPAEHHAAMSWAKRLTRVFNIDIETCEHCGGTVKMIASIEDPAVINTLLDHLEKNTAQTPATRALPPAARAPPQAIRP